MSLINTGLSGLLAAQRALDVTSNNVANASTDGYVRRRVMQSEAVSAGSGLTANVGNGVNVTSIDRMYDQFVTDQLRTVSSSTQRAQTLSDLSGRLDSITGDPDLGISNSIQNFFNQVEVLSQDPTSSTNRQQVLQQADSLEQRFRQVDAQIGSLGNEVNLRLQSSVSSINNIAASLARINATLAQGSQSAGNDLADQRDLLIKQLSDQIDAKILPQSDGTVNVLIGNGQPLVLGVNSGQLKLVPDAYDPTVMQVAYTNGTDTQVISRQIAGGTLGGLLAFRSEALDPARRDLGLLADGLTATFNAQNRMGLDGNGQLGGDFFAPLQPLVLPNAGNNGSGTLTAVVANSAQLAANDYEFRFDGTNWSVTNPATGAAVAMTGAGTAANPFVVDGMQITVGGTASAGDRFLIRPASSAAGRMAAAISDPMAIAAAAPLATGASVQNLSQAAVSTATVTDVTNATLLQPVRIVFDDPTTFRIRSTSGTDLSGPLAYTSGANISFNGWSVQVTGSPAAGDSFSVQSSGPRSGDNSNAQALANAASQGFFSGGTVSISDLANQMVAKVGSTALRASQDYSVQTALQQQVQQDYDSIAGVNLNEEAANMLKYQQAYMAASKIIAISNDMFQTLLSTLR